MDNDQERVCDVRIKNVTPDGMCLISWTPIKPGRRIMATIPDLDGFLAIGAVVRRCHHTTRGWFEIGVQVEDEALSEYKNLHDAMWEIECYRKAAEKTRSQVMPIEKALAEWRKKFAPGRFSAPGARAVATGGAKIIS
jgi:hypothetical protein